MLVAQACDPANYAKVHKRPRCPAAGCRDKLTTINSYRCKDCGATVCLRHRFASDHQCPGRPGVRLAWAGCVPCGGLPAGTAVLSVLFTAQPCWGYMLVSTSA